MGINDLLNKQDVLGVENHPVLVGAATDGAAVNIGEQNSMRARLQRSLPWMFWTWCFAHGLELACHDALSSDLFKRIDSMLVRLYYLYEKSPKKCRDLEHIVNELK